MSSDFVVVENNNILVERRVTHIFEAREYQKLFLSSITKASALIMYVREVGSIFPTIRVTSRATFLQLELRIISEQESPRILRRFSKLIRVTSIG